MSSALGLASSAQAGPSRREPAETRRRLLDAAERLFAERGFEGTSLRALTQAAGTSVSAAHYHFGSKQALLAATLHAHVDPINQRRLALLAARVTEAGDRPIEVEALLDAFLRPIFEARAQPGGGTVRMVAVRLFADPPEIVAELKQELFGDLLGRFLDCFEQSLPERPRDELALGLQFAVGVMIHVSGGHLDDAPLLEEASRAPDGLLSDASVLAHLIRFVAAGLRAPALAGGR